MQGKIIRGVGGFYYVHVPSIGLLECKARVRFATEGSNLWLETM